MCASGKITFVTPQDANKALRHMVGHHAHSGSARKSWTRGKAVAYKCTMCGLWHVGREPKRRKRESLHAM